MTTAIVVSAGEGTRMKKVVPSKQLAVIGGMPVIAHTLAAFESASLVDRIIVVARGQDIKAIKEIVRDYGFQKVTDIITGGSTRQQSVRNGLSRTTEADLFIAIHDGARPLIQPEDINRVVQMAQQTGAAILGAKVSDTLKRVQGDNIITQTIDRSELYGAQTPQVFSRKLLINGFSQASGKKIDATDDSQLLERIGVKVALVEALHHNFKITTPGDLQLAELLLAGLQDSHSDSSFDFRIGQGYDVHRLVEGRKLILGGVEIPFEKGLTGHSDADAVCHAVTDALLGAAGLGDIGTHFPDTDPAYLGANSVELLKKATALLRERNWVPINLDITVIAQQPKIAPYASQMRTVLADALKIPGERVNIKGKTEEGMGFTGSGEGIAAQAVCMIKRSRNATAFSSPIDSLIPGNAISPIDK